ncbi:hypothetical protein ACFOSV_14985 [Algoriphagus namhaensis]|uniref:Uncharacterized protein n=1 Tax=Algoriphagus namhaensis TaxID=915353 RepID=A0ABV8AVA5_9BACT
MSLFFSLILFFTHALSASDGVGELLQINPFEQSIQHSADQEPGSLYLHAIVDDENRDLGYLENLEEEEKTESEVEHPSDSFRYDFSDILNYSIGNAVNSIFTTKSLATNVPLYKLFHSWRSYQA